MVYFQSKLRHWIKLQKLDFRTLSENPNAIELLKKYPNKINWSYLSSNINAIEILKNNINKISWFIYR